MAPRHGCVRKGGTVEAVRRHRGTGPNQPAERRTGSSCDSHMCVRTTRSCRTPSSSGRSKLCVRSGRSSRRSLSADLIRRCCCPRRTAKHLCLPTHCFRPHGGLWRRRICGCSSRARADISGRSGTRCARVRGPCAAHSGSSSTSRRPGFSGHNVTSRNCTISTPIWLTSAATWHCLQLGWEGDGTTCPLVVELHNARSKRVL